MRKLLGVSRLQRLKNKDIRSQLQQTETICYKIQKGRLRWFGHVKRMDTNRSLTKVTECNVKSKRNRGKQPKCRLNIDRYDLI